MPRTRRRIDSLCAYELCFRARNTLPLVAYRIIEMIIQHSLARAQRDEKVRLCHDIWNGSHSHLIILAVDAEQCKKLYMETQKKITDCLKRLFGLEHLTIWEGRPMVAKIADLDEGIRRIAYLYGNPSKDDLESAIEYFPGYSSWKEFQKLQHEGVQAAVTEEVLRLRLPSFPKLQSQTPSPEQEAGAIRLLKDRNKEKQPLIRHPNQWMQAFGVRDREVPEVNNRIIKRLRQRENAAERLRKMRGRTVMGRAKLKRQPILKPHSPRKKERKIFYLGSCNKARIEFLVDFKEFCNKCAECYQEWLKGNFLIQWPPGAFKPPLPPNTNVLPVAA